MFYHFCRNGRKQISATSRTRRANEVERYVEAHGVKKGSLVEQALLIIASAARAPQDIVIPPRLRISPPFIRSGRRSRPSSSQAYRGHH